MKNFDSIISVLTDFAISNEEMINIRGGENDEIIKPAVPPVII